MKSKNAHNETIELGYQVTDKLSGFSGHVEYIARYIHDSDKIGIQAPLDKHAKKPLNTMQIQKAMDGTLKADGALKYEIEQHGERKKLIGIGRNFRSFAYFTNCIEPAKQAIRTEWLFSRGAHEDI